MVFFSNIMNFNFSAVSAPSAVTYLGIFREIRVNSWIRILPYLKKRTQFSPFLAQKPRFAEKRTQNEPNQTQMTTTPKMSLISFMKKSYAKLRLCEQNENEPNLIPLGQSGQIYPPKVARASSINYREPSIKYPESSIEHYLLFASFSLKNREVFNFEGYRENDRHRQTHNIYRPRPGSWVPIHRPQHCATLPAYRNSEESAGRFR